MGNFSKIWEDLHPNKESGLGEKKIPRRRYRSGLDGLLGGGHELGWVARLCVLVWGWDSLFRSVWVACSHRRSRLARVGSCLLAAECMPVCVVSK